MRQYIFGCRPKPIFPVTMPFLALVLGGSIGCSRDSHEHVQATYDKASGKLSQLTVSAATDGKPNTFSYMNGTKFVRIEIDTDEDGKIDRWEYYGEDQRLERVGFSRANDGKVDGWAFQGIDGMVERVEVSTKRDGKPNRTEFYDKGMLTQAEEDTDVDGRIDRWERYEGGALASVAFDTAKSGKPTTTIDYKK
jgi:hypothetical protein